MLTITYGEKKKNMSTGDGRQAESGAGCNDRMATKKKHEGLKAGGSGTRMQR
jgi:hypothetical protein